MKGKFLSLIVASIMVTSVFSACQANNSSGLGSAGKSGSSAGSGSAGSKSAEIKKPETIKFFSAAFIYEETGRKEVLEEYKKETGINLEVNQPAYNQYYDSLNLAFSSGDVPDAIEIVGQNYLKYAVNGGLADITKLVENSEALKKANQTIVDSVKVNGKLYGFPFSTGGGSVTMIRKDWLDNLGLKAPTNYDEFYNMLLKFTNNDPDKNGKNDTYGFTGALVADNKLQEQYLRPFYWKSSPDFHYVDGKWVDGFAQQDYLDALKRLNKAYKDKVLDQEVFTNKTSTARDKIASSKAGVINYWANYWLDRLDNSIVQTSNPNGSLLPITPIKEAVYLNNVPDVTAITSKCKNVDGVFKYFVEYMHDGGPGQNLFCFGVENVHWQKKDGNAVMLPQLNNPKQLFDKVYFSVDTSITPFQNPLVPIAANTKLANDVFANSTVEQMRIFPPSETYVKNVGAIDKLRQEIASKIIIGAVTPEEGMAQYKADAEKLEINKILSEFNSAK